jgi:hypothetical protein
MPANRAAVTALTPVSLASPEPALVIRGLAPPEPIIAVLLPSLAALPPPSVEEDSFPLAVEDAFPELSEGDSLPTSKIQLHIAINVISHLNAVEDFNSLLAEELLLCEFLLDQILFLLESLESCLVPLVVEELLGSKLVAPLPRLWTSLVLWL